MDHQVLYLPFTREEQVEVMEPEKEAMEERKRLNEAGLIGSTMDALVGPGVGLVGSGIGTGVGLVGSGIGAVGSGLGKAGKFMGRTVTGNFSSMSRRKRSVDDGTPVSSTSSRG